MRSSLQIVRKKRATAKGCNPFLKEVAQPVGRHPIEDQMVEDCRMLRPWQEEAFQKLAPAFFGMLIAPTGAGKSVVQKGLAYVLAAAGERIVIAVPESTISDPFNSETQTYLLPNGSKMVWQVDPENFLFNGNGGSMSSKVQKVVEFVTGSVAATSAKRVLVCTHMSLVLAHQKMLASGVHKPWDGVNVLVDECHHSRFESDEELPEDKKVTNELGAFVRHYLKHRPGRLLLSTATWLRGDAFSIVPQQYLSEVTEFHLPIDQYLDGLKYLKEIVFKFSVGEYDDILQTEIEESKKKTLVYLPPVQQGGVDSKMKTLSQLQKVLGRARREEHLHAHSSGVKSLDLVIPEGRDQRKGAFDKAKRAGRVSPDVIFVQNLFREGADWPEASRSLVLGSRGSLPMVIQMIGRLLRDHPGKKRVEFHMVLPKSVVTDIEQFTAYTNTVFMVMALGWQMGPTKKGRLHEAEVLRKLMSKLPGKVIEAENSDVSARDLMRTMLEETIRDLFGDEKFAEAELEQASRSLLDCLSPAFRLAAHATKDMMSEGQIQTFKETIESNPFKAGSGLFAIQWGPKQFQELRKRFGALPEVTPEYVCRLLFLERCIYFKQQGKYQNPRKFQGAVELFGSTEALDRACTKVGL